MNPAAFRGTAQQHAKSLWIGINAVLIETQAEFSGVVQFPIV